MDGAQDVSSAVGVTRDADPQPAGRSICEREAQVRDGAFAPIGDSAGQRIGADELGVRRRGLPRTIQQRRCGNADPPPLPKRKAADDDDAAQREAEARAERERLALEDELREARGTLKVRERVAKGAEADAQAAAEALDAAQAALDQARKAVEDAKAERESAQRVLKGAR